MQKRSKTEKLSITGILIFIIFRMSFFNCLLVTDMTAAGKNITACHFQIIVNGFQPVFHIYWFFVKGVYISSIKVGGDNLI